jgi:hypothetical protein
MRGENMPSKAFSVFKKNLRQTDKLLANFNGLRPPTRGRKHYDHLTRAALLFLCSTWEVYIEEVSKEVCEILSSRLSSPDELPVSIQKKLSSKVKNASHELEPITLAKDWKRYYASTVCAYTDRLNTPKKDRVLNILLDYFGVDEQIALVKIPSLEFIDAIVSVRGEIAHNIYTGEYFSSATVVGHKETIIKLVVEIEEFFWDYIPSISTSNKARPWQNTYSRTRF